MPLRSGRRGLRNWRSLQIAKDAPRLGDDGRPVGRRDGGIFREERFKVLDATAFIGVGDPQQPCNSLTDESRNAVACRVVAIALALLKPKHLIDLDHVRGMPDVVPCIHT